jgi:hypothetical protein
MGEPSEKQQDQQAQQEQLEQPIWRLAIKDSSHPLHQATWLLFTENMNLQAALKLLTPQREKVIEYLLQIIDTDELYLEKAFGGGFAPAHAIALLGEWQVKEAVPRLLKILREGEEDENWETIAYQEAVQALEKMDSSICDELLKLAEEIPDKGMQITVAGILGKVGKGDPKIYEWILNLFNKQEHEVDVEFVAGFLLDADAEAAAALIEERLKKGRYNTKRLKKILPEMIQDARKGIL